MASPISVSSYSATDASEAPSDPPAALASSSESSRTEAADLPAFFFLPRRHARVLACAEGEASAASWRTKCAADPPMAQSRGRGTPASEANEARERMHAGDARRLGAATAWTHSTSARAARRADIAFVTIGRAFARGGLVGREGSGLLETRSTVRDFCRCSLKAHSQRGALPRRSDRGHAHHNDAHARITSASWRASRRCRRAHCVRRRRSPGQATWTPVVVVPVVGAPAIAPRCSRVFRTSTASRSGRDARSPPGSTETAWPHARPLVA